ncbi:MAG: indolepyruvate ferredoxin oxidoreductase family protein, partial [Woeseia sp.]
VSETVESGMSIELPPYPQFVTPTDFVPPPGGLHIRWPDFPGPQIEERMEWKKAATLAFAKANPIDRTIWKSSKARYGIVTTGKAHHDLMEALRLLGIDQSEARRLGIEVYKVGMVWPLAHDSALNFVQDKHEVLVIEEKRGIIESQFKEYFYDYPGRKPQRMVGKEDENGERLVPWIGELAPIQLAEIVAKRLDAAMPGLNLRARADALVNRNQLPVEISGAKRTPYFCSGCPHNTSTKVPEGSQSLAGIGCHFMASWMDRDTNGLIQMGGEGINWIPRSMFSGEPHTFQNLGDGTFYHSGSMAIRQAIAAKTNITYKVLFNDAVAMTGGQPVDGPLTIEAVAHSVRAEGVQRIALVSDEPERFSRDDFPAGTTISHRREMDTIQRELREIKGVTVLIYAQTCATEKRRLRKRGKMENPRKIAVINDLVCEGCGDCSVESNCLSVVPKDTPFGRKRQIDQNTCNKDFSCVNGFCPSFVTVHGADPAKNNTARTLPDFPHDHLARLPLPPSSTNLESYDLLVTGVGGTGVITVGALITMAAHLEGKGASVLDFTGFAQKFGPVLSYIRIADNPDKLNQVRIDEQRADALIGCDLVVSSSPQASKTYKADHTRVVLNATEMPTADFVRHRDANLRASDRIEAIRNIVGDEQLSLVGANQLSEKLLGNTIYANVLLLGFAWQSGLVPVSLEAMLRAIELNGVDLENNTKAFAYGRLASAAPAILEKELLAPLLAPVRDETLEEMVERRKAFLTDYQDEKLGERFAALINRVRDAETAVGNSSMKLTDATVRAYFKTLAYKDEYEVARLHTSTGFIDALRKEHGPQAKLRFHLAPPTLGGKLDARGRPFKKEFGSWIVPVFRTLARLKGLRGGPFDIFGYTAERRMERALIVEFEQTVDAVLNNLDKSNCDDAANIVSLFMEIRGYGPVKDEAVASVRQRLEDALRNYTSGQQQAA